jgi:two-component system phosphate regulon sensor histidine kinase PhoR
MLKTLAGKLTALIIISILLSAGLSWIFATRGMRAEIDDIITADLAGDVDALEELINSRSEEYADGAPISQDVLARWSELLEVRITLIDSKGNVLADSSVEREDIGSMDNHGERPEVRDALLKGLGIDRRYSETTGVPYLYYAASIHIKGKTDPTVIRCSSRLPGITIY